MGKFGCGCVLPAPTVQQAIGIPGSGLMLTTYVPMDDAPANPARSLASGEWPVYAVAQLKATYVDQATATTVYRYVLKPNGNWLSDPKGYEYFTSFEALNFAHPVAYVSAPDGTRLWPASAQSSNGQTPVSQTPATSPGQAAAEAAAPAENAVVTVTTKKKSRALLYWILGGVVVASILTPGVYFIATRRAKKR